MMEGCLVFLISIALVFTIFFALAFIVDWGVYFVFNYDLGFWKAFVTVLLLWIVGRILFPNVSDK